MTISGTLNASDLARAQWLHVKPRPTFAVIGVVLLALFAWSLWYAATHLFRAGDTWVPWVLWGTFFYFILLFAVVVPYRLRRTFNQRKDLQRPFSVEVSETAFILRSGESFSTKPWTDFLKWKEDRHLFVLYIADTNYQLVPTRWFPSPDAVDAFRKILQSKVNSK